MQGNQPDILTYVDLDGALARMRGNKKLYRRMLALFLATPDYDGFEAAFAAGNMEQAEVHIHTLKGVAGNLSLTPLFETSNDLMGQLRTGAPKEETLALLRKYFPETMVAVQALIAQLDAELA